MHRKLIALTATLLLLGCQGASWQNPYAAIGPVTVPPPGMQAAASGYYTPPAATPTISATTVPVIDVAAGNSRPLLGSTIRTDIAAKPRNESAAPSFSTSGTTTSAETPIRIVEAAPSSKPASSVPAPINATSQPRATFPIREPATAPGVVTATPSSAFAVSGVPAIKFNPSAAPAELSQLPKPPTLAPANTIPASPSPALNRTRGFGSGAPPPAPATTTPPNRLSAAPGMLIDPAVQPATFVETTTAAGGQWKAR